MVFGKHFTKYYLKYLLTFIIGIGALILVDIYQLKLPQLVGELINSIQEGQAGKDGLTRIVLLRFVNELIIIMAVVFSGRFLWRICIFGNGVKIETDIRNEMFEHMEKLSTTYYQKNKTGALMALYTNDLATIRRSFAGGTLMFVDALTLGVIALIKMLRMSWLFTIVSFVPLALVSAFAALMRKRISKKVKLNLEAFSKLSDFTQEDFSGIGVIKAYVKEKKQEYLFKGHSEHDLNTFYSYVKDQALVQVIVNVVINVGMFGVIFLGGLLMYFAQIGRINEYFDIGDLITFNSLLGALVWPLMAIGDLINLRGQSKASEKRISDLLDEEIDIKDSDVVFDVTKEDIKGKITFNNLSFQYPLSPTLNLENISFTINSGEMIGIMGPTGSGKTTIVELLLRLYNIDEDKILIDDMDLMHLPIKTVREAIAYVPQETFLFKQTIDENISFSKESVDHEKNVEVSIIAGIDKDVQEFKDKYDTVLGERGVTVSGGQKQRISIARALLKESPILIMDDSLSAVDTITENHILNELRHNREGKTTIIIAHRITTLETLDRILVVDDGKIVDFGTHEELLKRCDKYIREVHLQELEKEVGGVHGN